VILVTLHRRENIGEPIENISKGLLLILEKFTDVVVLLPMHKNPKIRSSLQKILGHHKRVFLEEPFKYDSLIAALKNCKLVLTDSGGIQEEAPTFGKPVLIARKTTERKEAVESGASRLIGTKEYSIFKEIDKLLSDSREYDSMVNIKNPFGDGKASERIVQACIELTKNLS
jgi:UDP-N-acetylglucosamine 2-epimerase (non-hydrolysing)